MIMKDMMDKIDEKVWNVAEKLGIPLESVEIKLVPSYEYLVNEDGDTETTNDAYCVDITLYDTNIDMNIAKTFIGEVEDNGIASYNVYVSLTNYDIEED